MNDHGLENNGYVPSSMSRGRKRVMRAGKPLHQEGNFRRAPAFPHFADGTAGEWMCNSTPCGMTGRIRAGRYTKRRKSGISGRHRAQHRCCWPAVDATNTTKSLNNVRKCWFHPETSRHWDHYVVSAQQTTKRSFLSFRE